MRVAILGASRYNVPALAAVREAGFFVLAIDGNPQAPGLAAADAFAVADIRDADALREAILSSGGVDGIVTLGEAAVRSSVRVCSDLGLPTISAEAALNATSKIRMRRCWDAIAQFSVPWRHVLDEQQALEAADAVGGFPVVVKPDRTHGGSRGVTRADDREQLIRAYHFARSSGFSEDVIVEKFIDSESEHSTEVLIHDGAVSMLCIGQKIKTHAPYRVDLSVRYPSMLDRRQEALVADMCRQAVMAIGLTRGVAHIELAWSHDGPRLLELGARCGGGHTPLLARHSSGVDELAEVCRIACGRPPELFQPIHRRGAEYRFLAFPAGIIEEAIVPAEVLAHPHVVDAAILGAPGSEVREVRTGADRAGFVVTTGENLEEAVRAADWASARVAIRYADGATHGAFPVGDRA